MLQALLDRVRQAHTAELEGGEEAEAGFTLIELMVVLLILAILMAIAIPTFLGVTGGANDRAAQSNLTNAMTEASAIYQSNSQSFTGLTPGSYSASAPEFTWTTSGATSQNQIDVAGSSDGNGVGLATLSKTGRCWYLLSFQQTPASGATVGTTTVTTTTAGTFYGVSAKGTTETTCSAADAAKATGTSYSNANSITPAGGI